jgi:D-sedoheptulose 7-phosphate isomerase
MQVPVDFCAKYFDTVNDVVSKLDFNALKNLTSAITDLKSRKGRLFIIGVGGSAGNASHAVNDFRKLAGIESYAPTDNISELTARTNDEGWESVFTEWLLVSRLTKNDAILVLSVGGGSIEKKVSMNISLAVEMAKKVGAPVLGIVGKEDGDTAKFGDAIVIIPEVEQNLVTPMAESFQALIWHMLVMHPDININRTKW